MKLSENETVKYRVMYNDNVLMESASKHSAEIFVSTLSKDTQESVKIVPITNEGLQVLLG